MKVAWHVKMQDILSHVSYVATVPAKKCHALERESLQSHTAGQQNMPEQRS